MNGAQVGIFEETYEVGFSSLLEGQHGTRLEAEFFLEVVGDLTNESLEGEFTDEEFGGLLVFSDLTESDSSGSESVGLFDSTSGGGTLSGSLSGEVLTGSLSSSRFSSGLLCSGHLLMNFQIILF